MYIVNTEHSWHQFREIIEKNGFDKPVLIKYSKYHKDITWLLAVNGIKFNRISFGAGIYKLIPFGSGTEQDV